MFLSDSICKSSPLLLYYASFAQYMRRFESSLLYVATDNIVRERERERESTKYDDLSEEEKKNLQVIAEARI